MATLPVGAALSPSAATSLPWVQVAAAAPYFSTDDGEPWLPIGQNDAVTWPDLAGLFRRRDLAAVEGHLAWLAAHGVTCLRLMLEYCQTEHRYLERPIGRFQPNMVQLWDDLFALCARYNLRVLLTPYDTFWMWRRWRHHPYSQAQGGPVARRSRWLTCPVMRQAIKNRLTFAAERWGGSGVLLGWDLWNELHPAQAQRSTAAFAEFVADISAHLRAVEQRCFGRSHPQTVSIFGPVLHAHPAAGEVIFQHPALDFATSHFYDAATLNNPRNTVAPALHVGELVRAALGEAPLGRPFFDSEHGPIDTFKSGRTLPAAFDDEYFRRVQWAHLAAGGAGGGLRWPYRQPHQLTHGMRAAQRSLAAFAQLLDWPRFRRRNLNHEVQVSEAAFAVLACGDAHQALVWLLRQDHPTRRGTKPRARPPLPVQVRVPHLADGLYLVQPWDTLAGLALTPLYGHATAGELVINLMAATELALAIQPATP